MKTNPRLKEFIKGRYLIKDQDLEHVKPIQGLTIKDKYLNIKKRSKGGKEGDFMEKKPE